MVKTTLKLSYVSRCILVCKFFVNVFNVGSFFFFLNIGLKVLCVVTDASEKIVYQIH